MNKLIWDGNIDYGWEDLSCFFNTTCHKFVNIILKTIEESPNPETKELITIECMARFESIVGILSGIIKDASYYVVEDIDNNSENALKLNCWILLGSLTETTLQIFLALYIDDYKKTKWQLWEILETEQIQKPIINCIEELANKGTIESNQAKSLKKAIKKTIKEHTKEHKIEKIMLDELINLYVSLKLIDEDELFYLKCIQINRNSIHSFQNRKTGTWNDLQYCIRFYCYLLEWVDWHLPDIPNYE